MNAPGRSCPLHYRYQPEALNGPVALRVDTLYLAGGLYGNLEALDALEAMLARERVYGSAALVLNGDFNWFDVDPVEFAQLNERALAHDAIQGNVEAELARPAAEAGCGCAYPAEVDDGVVRRSNAIMARLHGTAAGFPALRARLAALPRFLTAQVGGVRVAVVHGDAHSLAGWDFDQARLPAADDAAGQAALAQLFTRANCQIFASSHTCLPCAQDLLVDAQPCAVINNGAAGMPNFRADRRGVITRISVHRPRVPVLYGRRLDGLYLDALPLAFDSAAWLRRFARSWQPGSAAHQSYHRRLLKGPDYALRRAPRGGFALFAGETADAS